MKITKPHRYLGKWYKAGQDCKNNDHAEWARDPARRYVKSANSTKSSAVKGSGSES